MNQSLSTLDFVKEVIWYGSFGVLEYICFGMFFSKTCLIIITINIMDIHGKTQILWNETTK